MRIRLLFFLFMLALAQLTCGDDHTGSTDGNQHGDSSDGAGDTPADGSASGFSVIAVPMASAGRAGSGRFEVLSGIVAPAVSCATGSRFSTCPLTGVRP